MYEKKYLLLTLFLIYISNLSANYLNDNYLCIENAVQGEFCHSKDRIKIETDSEIRNKLENIESTDGSVGALSRYRSGTENSGIFKERKSKKEPSNDRKVHYTTRENRRIHSTEIIQRSQPSRRRGRSVETRFSFTSSQVSRFGNRFDTRRDEARRRTLEKSNLNLVRNRNVQRTNPNDKTFSIRFNRNHQDRERNTARQGFRKISAKRVEEKSRSPLRDSRETLSRNNRYGLQFRELQNKETNANLYDAAFVRNQNNDHASRAARLSNRDGYFVRQKTNDYRNIRDARTEERKIPQREDSLIENMRKKSRSSRGNFRILRRSVRDLGSEENYDIGRSERLTYYNNRYLRRDTSYVLLRERNVDDKRKSLGKKMTNSATIMARRNKPQDIHPQQRRASERRTTILYSQPAPQYRIDDIQGNTRREVYIARKVRSGKESNFNGPSFRKIVLDPKVYDARRQIPNNSERNVQERSANRMNVKHDIALGWASYKSSIDQSLMFYILQSIVILIMIVQIASQGNATKEKNRDNITWLRRLMKCKLD